MNPSDRRAPAGFANRGEVVDWGCVDEEEGFVNYGEGSSAEAKSNEVTRREAKRSGSD